MEEKKNIFLRKDHLFIIGWYIFLLIVTFCIFFFSSLSCDEVPSFNYFIFPCYWKALLLYFYGFYGVIGFFIGHVFIILFLIYYLCKKKQPSYLFYFHGFLIPLFFSLFAFIKNKGFYSCGMLGEISGEILRSYFQAKTDLYFIIIIFLYIVFLVGIKKCISFIFNVCRVIFYLTFFKIALLFKRYAMAWILLFLPKLKKYFSDTAEKNTIEEAIYRAIYADFYDTACLYGINLAEEINEDKGVPLYKRFKDKCLENKNSYLEVVSPEEQKFIFDILAYFGVRGEPVVSFVGPLVKTIIFTPTLETKLQKIFLQIQDIGRASGHSDLRIQYPVAGFPSSVALEYAKERREVLNFFSYAFDPILLEEKEQLLVLLGVTTQGKPFFLNIKKSPHILLAGTTGSGKSSLLHIFIVNFLWKTLSSAVQLVLIDPKKTEFEIYAQIPHLLFPIACYLEEIQDAIDKIYKIMNQRYELFQSKKCRNIDEYNALYDRLSYIVVIIDEYADIVMQSKQIEGKILRVLQLSRAAGIHVILATQRPSADILNTTLKSNLPVRIACKVASALDSRIVLDTEGAQQLLGNGDMIIFENSNYIRIHGLFIDYGILQTIVKAI